MQISFDLDSPNPTFHFGNVTYRSLQESCWVSITLNGKSLADIPRLNIECFDFQVMSPFQITFPNPDNLRSLFRHIATHSFKCFEEVGDRGTAVQYGSFEFSCSTGWPQEALQGPKEFFEYLDAKVDSFYE